MRGMVRGILETGIDHMKRAIIVVSVVVLVLASWYLLTRDSMLPAPAGAFASGDGAAEASGQEAAPETAPAQPVAPRVAHKAPAKLAEKMPPEADAPQVLPVLAGTGPVASAAIATLVAPTATYQEKQAAFAKLRDSGKLDLAITELEQRMGADPKTPEYPATLGQAYLQKAGSLNDMREQGILGMKADQTFEAALQLDPTNWEASYWKATAMSYWPDMLNKTRETAQQFIDTIHIQEARTPQPEYARTYIQLGDYYKNHGQADYAAQIWKRGLTHFPNDGELTQRLAQ